MTPNRWQYKTVHLKTSAFAANEKKAEQMNETMNRLGAQGWGLVNTAYDGAGFWAFLKKPL